MEDARGGPSRRWFLAGGVAVLLGAGAGVTAELLTHRHPARPRPPTPPQALVEAVAVERALLADLDATTGGEPAVRAIIAQVRADHSAHLRALTALVASYGELSSAPSPAESSAAPSGTPRTRAALRAAEQQAAAGAAHRANTLTGAHAALLASISAAEASHADLLS